MPRWLILLLLPLAACAGDPGSEAAEATMAAHRASLEALGAGRRAAAAAPIVTTPTPGAPLAGAPLVGGPLVGDPATSAQTHATPGWHAAGLLGAAPEAVRAALGEPLLRRTEGPAQIWLYAGGGCQLDIVLYTGEEGPRVAHIQARAGGIAQRTEASCLRDISAQAAHPHRLPAPLPRREAPSSLGQGVEFDV